MGIKILIDPVYTLRETWKCITHYALDECARYVLKTYPDSFVYYIAPVKADFKQDLAEDFPGRVKYFSGMYWPNNRVYEFMWQPEWFKDIAAGTGFAWDWDLLLTTRGPGMIPIRWTNWPRSLRPKKILIHDHFPLLDFKVGAASLFEGFKDLNLATLTSYVLSDRVIVGSQYEVDGIMTEAKRYLSMAKVKELSKKVQTGWVVPRGLDIEYPLKEKPIKKKGDTLVGIFTQRLGSSGRHPDLVFNSFMYPFVKRPLGSVEFQLSTNSLMDLDEATIRKYRFLKKFKATREEFYEILKGSDFCISFSTTESIPTSILEAICWGCIPVLIRSKWSVDMVGKEYPLLFDTMPQAVTHIEGILNKPAEARERFNDWYRKWWMPFLEKNKNLFWSIDALIKEHENDIKDLYRGREDNEITKLSVDYIKSHKIKRVTLSALQRQMYKDKVIRVSPDQFDAGSIVQLEAGRGIPYRHPKPYQVLHSILKATGWNRGVEVGEIVVKGGRDGKK